MLALEMSKRTQLQRRGLPGLCAGRHETRKPDSHFSNCPFSLKPMSMPTQPLPLLELTIAIETGLKLL